MQRRATGIIFLVIFFDLLGFGIIIPQLGVYARLYDASGTVQGLLVASYSMMQFVFAPILGRWSDRLGRKPVLLVSLFTSLLGHLLFAFAGSLSLLFASRLVDGLGGANIATAQAYLADITPAERRTKAMGLIGAAFGIGFVLGPAVGGVVGHWGVTLLGTAGGNLFIGGAAALCSLVTLLLTAVYLPESLPPAARDQEPRPIRLLDLGAVRQALARPVLGRLLAIFLVSTSGFAVLHAIMSYFVMDCLGIHVVGDQAVADAQLATAKVFAWIGLLAAFIQGGAIGPLAKRLGEQRLLGLGLGLMTIGLLLLPTAGSLLAILALATPLAIGNAMASATLPSLITFHSPSPQRGEMLGISQSMGSIGRIIGPLSGGFLYDGGPALPFWVGAVLCTLALGLAQGVPARQPEAPHPPESRSEG